LPKHQTSEISLKTSDLMLKPGLRSRRQNDTAPAPELFIS